MWECLYAIEGGEAVVLERQVRHTGHHTQATQVLQAIHCQRTGSGQRRKSVRGEAVKGAGGGIRGVRGEKGEGCTVEGEGV